MVHGNEQSTMNHEQQGQKVRKVTEHSILSQITQSGESMG
jgi:hypothetical protein